MITHNECYYLGYISKAQGFKGGMIAYFDVDNPRSYAKLKRVLVDLHGVLNPFFISGIQLKDKGFVHLSFEGVNDKKALDPLIGKELFLPLSDLPKLPDHQYYLHELVGMQVADHARGNIGTVEQVLDFTTNPLIQVFYNTTEVLIPLNDTFVKGVDKGARIIHVELPEGLIDLNAQ